MSGSEAHCAKVTQGLLAKPVRITFARVGKLDELMLPLHREGKVCKLQLRAGVRNRESELAERATVLPYRGME